MSCIEVRYRGLLINYLLLVLKLGVSIIIYISMTIRIIFLLYLLVKPPLILDRPLLLHLLIKLPLWLIYFTHLFLALLQIFLFLSSKPLLLHFWQISDHFRLRDMLDFLLSLRILLLLQLLILLSSLTLQRLLLLLLHLVFLVSGIKPLLILLELIFSHLL